jgi:threonine/homoserine efflux transporter RhtA
LPILVFLGVIIVLIGLYVLGSWFLRLVRQERGPIHPLGMRFLLITNFVWQLCAYFLLAWTVCRLVRLVT